MGNIPWFGFTHNATAGGGVNATMLGFAASMGCHFIRIQQNMANIWINQTDPPSAWSWASLDAAVLLAQQNGFEVILTLDDYPSFQPGTVGIASEQSSSEPWFMPTGDFQVQYAVAAAQRYPTVKYLEMGNETYNIHFTPTSVIGTVTLNGNLSAGNPITTIPITASTISAPINSIVEFTDHVSGDYCQLAAPLAVNATSLSVASIVPNSLSVANPWVPLYTHSSGYSPAVDQRGINFSPWAMYNGLSGTSQSHQPQPARDPQFMIDNIRRVYRAVKAVRPDMQMGSPAIWWTQGQNQVTANSPGNHFAFTSGYGMNEKDLHGAIYEYYDYKNFHYYSNSNAPQTGGAQTAPFFQALYNIDAGIRFNDTPSKPIHLTEIGWQVPTDIDDATRATWFTYCLNVFKQYTVTTGKPNRFLCFTVEANGASTSQSSLITWNGVSSYNTTASYAAVQSFVQQNASLL